MRNSAKRNAGSCLSRLRTFMLQASLCAFCVWAATPAFGHLWTSKPVCTVDNLAAQEQGTNSVELTWREPFRHSYTCTRSADLHNPNSGPEEPSGYYVTTLKSVQGAGGSVEWRQVQTTFQQSCIRAYDNRYNDSGRVVFHGGRFRHVVSGLEPGTLYRFRVYGGLEHQQGRCHPYDHSNSGELVPTYEEVAERTDSAPPPPPTPPEEPETPSGELAARVTALENRMAALDASMRALDASMRAQRITLEASMEAQRETLEASIAAQRTTLEASIVTLEETLEASNAKQQDIENRVSALEQREPEVRISTRFIPVPVESE